jgi:hypothetical protein
MTQFKLTRYAIGRQPEIDLTRAEFDAILVARQRTTEGLAVEELFNVVLGNYEEFERELLTISLTHTIYFNTGHDWSAAMDLLQLMARRLANLLTTAHAYCDQVPHSISTLYGSASSHVETVRGFFRYEHSQTFAYRVCAELRRYVQHRGAAVHGFNAASSWVTRDNGSRVMVNTVVPEISTRQLAEDAKFKRAVLTILESQGRKSPGGDDIMCDLRPIVRGYVAALGRVHLKVRELVSPELTEADTILREAVNRFANLDAGSSNGLAAMELSDAGLLEGRTPNFVSTKLIERRQQLATRNHSPTRFEVNAVTNESPPLAAETVARRERADHT